jgi:inhibitor of KinA sporulation pathway (predicted exonuclease)
LDLSRLFTSKTGRLRGNRGAARLLGLPIEGRRHRGLDDARRIATMLPFLLT